MVLAEFFVLFTVAAVPFSKSAAEIGIFSSIAAWLLARSRSHERWEPPPLAAAAYGLFLAVTLVSVFRAPDAAALAWRGFFKWAKFVAFFFVVADVFREPARARRLVTVFLVSVFLLTLNGFVQLAIGRDLVRGFPPDVPGRVFRMKSSLGSPNGLAGFYLIAFPLALHEAISRRGRWRLVYGACAFLFAAGLVLTFSRAAWLGLAAAGVPLLLTRRPGRAIWGTAIAVGALLLWPPARENLLSFFDPKDITAGERLQFWRTTWSMILDRPWLGHGVNTYFTTFPRFAPPEETYRGYAHNCYLQMWSEIGIIGLAAFLVPLRSLARAIAAREFFGRQALAWGLGALLIQSFFDTHLYALQSATLFWAFWGLFHAKRAA